MMPVLPKMGSRGQYVPEEGNHNEKALNEKQKAKAGAGGEATTTAFKTKLQ